MHQLVLSTVLGRLTVRAPSEELARSAVEPAIAAALDGRATARRIELGGRAAWLKGGPLAGSAAWRYGLRRSVLRLFPPRGRELANLAWLRARLFRVPEPLAGAWVSRGPRLGFQLLVTGFVEDARSLESALEDPATGERLELIEELAREAARMHALRFIHHDLHLRNLQITPPHEGEGDPRRLLWLDCWRGGPHHPWRDAAYDLGCLMLEAAGLLDLAEQRRFVAEYLAEREAQGRPADGPALLSAAARERERLLRRVAREPGRWRSARPPVKEWDWTSLGA